MAACLAVLDQLHQTRCILAGGVGYIAGFAQSLQKTWNDDIQQSQMLHIIRSTFCWQRVGSVELADEK
jgi:hypothetical protein